MKPSLMTLFSSTSVPSPSPLFISHLDEYHPESSIIRMIADNAHSGHMVAKTSERGSLSHQVIHIQGPDMSKTYIQAGCPKAEFRRRLDKGKAKEGDLLPLGIELGWVGMHIRRLGRRDLAFEVGVVDSRGREGIIRISSFKVAFDIRNLAICVVSTMTDAAETTNNTSR